MLIITTPTGRIGHQVLENVIDSPEPIRVIVRDPARLPARVLGRVEVVQGSHRDSDVVDRAFAGADAVFWLVPPDPQAESPEAAYVDFTRPAVAAFQSHRVKRVVGVSTLGRGTDVAANAGLATASLAMDDLIASSGVSYRALTMPSFMDNLLNQVETIRSEGVFSLPISGDHKLPSTATRDIAAVAARLLLDDSWSGVSNLPVLGPENLTYNDMAQIMSEVLRKPVRFQQIPDEAFKSSLTGFGVSEPIAQAVVDMFVAKDKGLDEIESRTPQSITPTTFRQWCEEALKPAVMSSVRA